MMMHFLSKEDKLAKIKGSISRNDSLHCILRKNVARFEDESRRDEKGIIPIMTYGNYVIYLKSESSSLPKIPLSKFNYTSGTFEKKWGSEHKTIVLTPNHSSIRKVEIEIKGLDIHKMALLPDKKGDVIEDTAMVKITRHYRFFEGDSENKGDARAASPGEANAKEIGKSEAGIA